MIPGIHKATAKMLHRRGYRHPQEIDGKLYVVLVLPPPQPVPVEEAIAHCHRLTAREKCRAYKARRRK